MLNFLQNESTFVIVVEAITILAVVLLVGYVLKVLNVFRKD